MRKSAVKITLLLLVVGLVAIAVSGTTNQRQVGGFVAQLPPQAPPATQPPGQQSQAGVTHRRLTAKSGVSLVSLLEPEDQVVEVSLGDSPPFVGGYEHVDPGTEVERFMTNPATPALAIVTVTRRESRFTAQSVPESIFYAPDDWITTTLTVDVQTVLRDTTGQLVAGSVAEIQERGGEMVLNDGRRIIARTGLARPTRTGGTYLAVLEYYEGRFLFNELASVEFDQGKIKRMRTDAPPDSELERRTPAWLIEQVRANEQRRIQQ